MIPQLTSIVEKLGRPGVLGARGRKAENAVRAELEGYFAALASSVVTVKPEELYTITRSDISHAVEQKLYNPLRLNRTRLVHILAKGLMNGVLQGWKHDHRPGKKKVRETAPTTRILEADEFEPLDNLGLTGEKAAEFAAEQAAKLVVGIDKTTRERIANAISTGIEDQLGIPGTARLVRSTLSDMTTSRSLAIAATEVNDAFTFAALTKMKAQEVEYKRLILSPDACPICEANEAQGPIPVDDDFESGDDGPPFHPLCRCAVTGARNPDEEDNDE